LIKSVCFVGRNTFENYLSLSQDGYSIAISITDPNAATARVPRGFAGVLRLSFDDVYEESIGVEVGSLPDADERHADGVGLFFGSELLCDAINASQIIDFLNIYAEKSAAFDLYVHCEAGISRSSAVARFVSTKFKCPIEQANPDTSAANRRLLRLLQKVSSGTLIRLGRIAIAPLDAPGGRLLVTCDGETKEVPVEVPSTRSIMMRNTQPW
jgi:predicted protein tyrosine phosphatase